MPALLSVGIDIGTSTTQVAFSRLQLENTAGYFSVPQVRITDKILLHKSRPQITPLLDAFRLDGEALRAIVAGEFQRAGLSPADVSTGAAIITGESARKENAAGVLAALSGLAGDFVVSTAGPDLESVIAGKGSGAWKYSLDHHCCTANLDIGGGTTNIALFQNGEVISTGCYDIGGRLVRLSPSLEILGLWSTRQRISSATVISGYFWARASVGPRTFPAFPTSRPKRPFPPLSSALVPTPPVSPAAPSPSSPVSCRCRIFLYSSSRQR